MVVEDGTVVATRSTGTDGCFITWVRSPQVARGVRAGQFVMVRLIDRDFPYLGRPFSIADVDPQDPDVYAIVYTVVGEGTSALAATEPGAKVRTVGRLGNWFDVVPAQVHVFVAGGIGVAPFPVLSRQIAAADPSGRQVCYLGAANAGGLHLARELDALGVEVRTSTLDGSSREGGESFRGNVVEHLVADGVPDGARVYACGPNPMFAALSSALAGSAHAKQASLEEHMACGFGACNACVIPVADGDSWRYELICLKGPVFDLDRICWDPAAVEESAPSCR